MDRPLQKTLEQLIDVRTNRRDAVTGILAAGGAMSAIWCLPGVAVGGSDSSST